MKFKDRKHKHDDAHFPMQGKGKRGTKRKPKLPIPPGALRKCFHCPAVGPLENDHPCDEIDYARGSHWREFKLTNSSQATEDDLNPTRESV